LVEYGQEKMRAIFKINSGMAPGQWRARQPEFQAAGCMNAGGLK